MGPRLLLAPLAGGSTWRRGVFLLLGGVLALPYALLAAAFTQLLTRGEVPRPLVLLLLAPAVAIAAVPVFLDGSRALEIAAARALLGVDLPEPAAGHRIDRETSRRAADDLDHVLGLLREADVRRAGRLAAFATVGAVLTVGLTRPWGERFPRWMPRLAGRRVPPRLALVPAALVALAVTGAGVAELGNPGHLLDGFSSATAPLLLWPLWGPALGAAALAYHLRRRGACRRCGRG
ncbi:hypothetical protein ACFY2R_01815 [Micromonospora olivasterospora]|uniref:Uncharacterized protein n=1 Tax=Micromonospora olivasterospora TaxID=1880 RepID=A0A562ICZ0_MICOL|nr:hypothetical protein [Micromonospora olivasterospora]TWH68583.1 hypothetical protein JD77_03580 [Micromonospora olivasterospora]